MCRLFMSCSAVALLALGLTSATSRPVNSQQVEHRAVATKYSDSEHRQAQQWQLTISEWQRYQALMKGIRGSVSVSTISPIEVLGIHARDESERRRYAELWAQMMHEDTERVLHFQRAYTEAFRRLYGDELLVDLAMLSSRQSPVALQAGDRLMFFTQTDCARCNAQLPKLLRAVQKNPGVGLDVYLTNSTGDDAEVRVWAHERKIPPALVRNKTVTLNHDNGVLASLAADAEVPYLIHRRFDRLEVISAARLEP